jgi:hypothetical protein
MADIMVSKPKMVSPEPAKFQLWEWAWSVILTKLDGFLRSNSGEKWSPGTKKEP